MRIVWLLILAGAAAGIMAYFITSDNATTARVETSRGSAVPGDQKLQRETLPADPAPSAQASTSALNLPPIDTSAPKDIAPVLARTDSESTLPMLGSGARSWIAWRLLYVSGILDSPPCSIRVSGEALPVRFRAFWNSPNGAPGDPDFLIEMQSQWRARALKLVAFHADKLGKSLFKLRTGYLASTPNELRPKLIRRFGEIDDALQRDWSAFLESSAGDPAKKNALKAPAGNGEQSALAFPYLGCARILTFSSEFRLDSEFKIGQSRQLELENEAASAWESESKQLLADGLALIQQTEDAAALQAGSDLAPGLKAAWRDRRGIDAQFSDGRISATLRISKALTAESLAAELRSFASQENQLPRLQSVYESERKMYALGILRVQREKVVLPSPTPSYLSRALLDEMNSMQLQESDANAPKKF